MHKIISVPVVSALFAVCTLAAAGAALAADPAGSAAAPALNQHAQRQQHFFDKLDTNHDGVISRAEYQAWVDSRFAKLDTNGDGSVDANEIATSPATAARVQKRAEGFVKRYDQSGTGKVSKADFEAKEMSRFDRLSGGADTLTEQQLAAQRAAFMHGHGPHAAGVSTAPNGG